MYKQQIIFNIMELTRINNDVNGNPRYVFHFMALLNENELKEIRRKAIPLQWVIDAYNVAAAKTKQIGGKKYRGKDYGGGIVVQSHNINETIKQIENLKNNTF